MFAGMGAAAYLLALLATVPAAFVVPRGAAVAALGGTVWHGTAALVGGDRLEWRWAPLRTLANLAFAADVTVEGRTTALAGRALVRPGSVRLDGVSGLADLGLLRAVAPGLGFACTGTMQLDLDRLALGGGDQRVEGRGVTEPAGCAPTGGTATAVPALALTAEHAGTRSVLTVAPAAQRRRTLLTVTLDEDGALALDLTAEGRAALPFIGPAS